MAKTKQLTVAIENRPGTLAQVARVLGNAKVNILGFMTTSSGAEGVVHVVADNPGRARKALADAGLSTTLTDVLHVELPNVPGALGAFAGKLAAKNINITSGYQTSARGARKAGVVLTVSDLAQAGRVR